MKQPLLYSKCIFGIFITLFLFVFGNSNAQVITTIAGGIGEDSSATIYGRLNAPSSITWDPAGNMYIWETNFVRKVNHVTGNITTIPSGAPYSSINYFGIFDNSWNIYYSTGVTVNKMDTFGNITPVAGNGSGGFSGDGSPATLAQLGSVSAIAIDGAGNIYIVDNGNVRIRKVNTSGVITTVAGGGTLGDGSPAISAALNYPVGVAVDATGNIYISERFTGKIRKVNTSGIISTIANTSRGGKIICDGPGNVYEVDDYGSDRVYKVNTLGILSTFAGNGSTGFSGDGGPAASASLNNAIDIEMDALGNIYIADQRNNRVRKVNTSGIISTVVGNGLPIGGDVGDGGPGLLAALNPSSLCLDGTGNVYIPQGTVVRKIDASGTISQIAGNGVTGFYGDGGPATAAELDNASSAVVDKFGNIYLSVTGSHRIRKITPSGIITTVAGGGTGGLGDGGAATAAVITTNGVAVDSGGNIYIADTANHRIRKVNVTTGIISTFAGTGSRGSTGDGSPAALANLNTPTGLAFDRKGNLYFSDGDIRKIDTSGIISTIATGTGWPQITIDKQGNLYYPSGYGINKLDTAGRIYTIAGNGNFGIGGERITAISSYVTGYTGVAIDTLGNLFISDGDNTNSNAIRKVCCLNSIADQPPFFRRGPAQNMAVCQSSGPNRLDTFMTITDPDAGNMERWAVLSAPSHGTLGGFPDSALSTGAPITPGGLSYTPVAGYTGTDHFTIKISDGIYYTSTVVTVTVTRLPVAITGASAACTGLTTVLSDGSGGGTWSSSNTAVATIDTTSGMVTGVSAGTVTITYTTSGVCTVTKSLVVSSSPAPVTGVANICAGTTTTLSNITPAGTWSSGNNSIATVGSGSGVVNGVSGGTVTISYTIASGCPAMKVVTVSPSPNAGVISGASSVCAGATITLSESASGGIWSSSNATATVSTGGVVNALAAGIDTIKYTVSNSCGTAAAIKVITINAIAYASIITGPSGVCTGNFITLSDSVSGGAWSSPDPHVLVFSGGIVTGISPGTATISYTVSGSCGTATVSKIIAINSVPYAGVITGGTLLCTGGTTALSDAIPGGTWSSGNPFVASISSTGVVAGMAVGGAVVSYTLNSACGITAAIAFINVNPATPISPVTGPSTVCAGNVITLSDPTPGGTWSSGNTAVATVGSTGIVTGVSPGVVAISYTGSLGCGVSVAAFNITVNAAPSAGAIVGTASLCSGASSLLTSYAAGGVWSSSNANAAVTPTGIVTGITAGADTIIYSVTNSCGTATATHTMNIYAAPAPGSIGGISALCAGAVTAFTDAASGGVWSSSVPSVAMVGSTGAVNGIAAGVTVISYSVTTGCGIAAATKTVTVSAPDAGLISGVTTLCGGGTSVLTDAAPGGIWSSSNAAVATIGASGVVTALAAGASVISYSVSTSCGTAVASAVFTVGALPVVSPVSGSTNICMGNTATLTDATFGGAWSSSNNAVATVSSMGIVTGVSAGTASISYMVIAGCGAAGATLTMHVDALPSAGTISGSSSVCESAVTTMSSGVAGGVWSSGNPSVATAGTASGIVTGVAAGNVLISYAVANVCGTAIASKAVTVNPLPQAGTISGGSTVCVLANITLSDPAAGGVWASDNALIAAAGSASGIVSGVAAGAAAISYTVANGCGTAVATKTITVNPLPDAGTITGPSLVCKGASITLGDIAAGGVWGSSNTLAAAVSSIGTVTGVAAGTSTISYTVTTSCGSVAATKVVTVSAPDAGTITGVTTLCPTGTATLNDAVAGGTWSSTSATVATISSAGVVTAVSPGMTVISYTTTNTCGTDAASVVFTVGALPAVAAIQGASAICKGSTATLVDGTIGGIWSSSNTAVATISGTGLVNGVSAGTSMVSYLVTAGCGTAGATAVISVEDVPTAGSISGTTAFCNGTTSLLAATVPGGAWSSSNSLIATVSNTGVVNGIAAGIVSVSYSVANSCGTAVTEVADTVLSTLSPGSIAGPANVCEGGNIALSETVPGGVWSISNPSVATISSAGVVKGISQGVATASYSVTNSCGISNATTLITLEPLPFVAPITGTTKVATGSSTTLGNATTGGAWSCSNNSIASVGADGTVTGVSPGTASVTYTVTSSFGCMAAATAAVTVAEGSNTTFNFGLFPNPASNNITITWQNQFDHYAMVVLTDVAGRGVIRKQIHMLTTTGSAQLNLNGVVPGVYMMTIQSTSDYFSGKLVVTK